MKKKELSDRLLQLELEVSILKKKEENPRLVLGSIWTSKENVRNAVVILETEHNIITNEASLTVCHKDTGEHQRIPESKFRKEYVFWKHSDSSSIEEPTLKPTNELVLHHCLHEIAKVLYGENVKNGYAYSGLVTNVAKMKQQLEDYKQSS